ncbi:condensation domain-containing protein, partial [Paenibacillus graminis]
MKQDPSGISHTEGPLQMQPVQSTFDGEAGEYWHTIIDNGTPLNMPLDYVRPAVKSYAGEVAMLRISEELAGKLERLAESETVSVETALLACYIVLLSKYAGQDTVLVGWAYGSLLRSGSGGDAGLTVLAGQVDWTATWQEYVNSINSICAQARNSQHIPYAEVVKKLELDRDPSRNPLFDALFQTGDVKTGWDKYDFALVPERAADGIQLKLEYDTALFSKGSMERLLHHYVNIVADLAEH